MSDSKSKLPDLKEIANMAGKLFNDIKKSVSEIVCDYQKNHSSGSDSKPAATRKASASTSKKTTAKAKKSEKE